MTHSEILRRLDEIEATDIFRGITYDTAVEFQFIVTALRASLAREQKLREALEGLVIVCCRVGLDNNNFADVGFIDKARLALEETSEEKK